MGWQVYDKYGAAKIAPASVQGSELDYAQITANTAAITATTEATSVAVITGNSVTYDGSKVKIEFYAPNVSIAAEVDFVVYRDSTPIGRIGVGNPGNGPGLPMKGEIFDTPSAGAHTYSIRAYVASGSVTVKAGTGGSGNLSPAYLRVTRADPQVVVKYVGVPGALIGQELDYTEITVPTAAITATTEATAVAVITGNPVAYDGSTKVAIEFHAPGADAAAGNTAYFTFWRDNTPIGRAEIITGGQARFAAPFLRMKDLPPAGTHTYKVTAHVNTSSVTVRAGAGGSLGMYPAYLSVKRAQ